MTRVVAFLMWFLPLISEAQFTYILDRSIPVSDLDGNNVSMPWAGGLNAAQVNTMDLDGDGKDDLVLFDRMANKVITFLNQNNTWVPAPQYENFFPPQVSSWLLLRDYNCDGKKDIFTGHVLGIKVFKNVTASGGTPAWEQHLFSTGFPDPESNVLMTEGTTTHINLQLQPDDVPAISDIDGDGDLDILNIQYAGSTIEFHQNLSVENGAPCDSLQFKRVTRAWGNFRECECGVFAFNGESCPPGSGSRTKHAGGKSLLALDIDGDQQQDLLLAEAECRLLYLLPNDGTSTNPIINRSSAFPPGHLVNFVLFPAAYYEDVDFDGVKDLIASPSVFTREYLNSDFRNATWYYRNTGSNTNPAFSFVQSDFLQGEMIDVGDNAVPAFADKDGDGDDDLFISTHSSANFTSRVHVYENTGSPSMPAFKHASDDYLGFSASRFYNVRIQFADMNGDGSPDLVFTATNFDNGATNLYYIRNQSTTQLSFNAATFEQLDFDLTYAENVFVTDINGDGLPDILAGRSEGNLEYWKNQGTPGAPLFALEEETYLGFGSSTQRQNLTCAIADLDGDGNADLLVGDQTGKLGVISNFRETDASESQLERSVVFDDILKTYGEKNLGGRIWPVVVNLFNANKPSIVVGNILGGIHILRHDEGASLPENPQLQAYPNPVSKSDILKVRADRRGTLEIFSVLGQSLSNPIILKANEVHEYTLPPLAAGLYMLKFTANNKSSIQRLVIR